MSWYLLVFFVVGAHIVCGFMIFLAVLISKNSAISLDDVYRQFQKTLEKHGEEILVSHPLMEESWQQTVRDALKDV